MSSRLLHDRTDSWDHRLLPKVPIRLRAQLVGLLMDPVERCAVCAAVLRALTSTPNQREFGVERNPATVEQIGQDYGSLKPCLRGSDTKCRKVSSNPCQGIVGSLLTTECAGVSLASKAPA